MGLTTPLLTTASGVKFGKSMGNAIWLSPELTSNYHFYQFFLNQADEDIEHLLKVLTFINIEEVEEILVEHRTDPARRKGQTRLAEEVTLQVRGKAALIQAQHATAILHYKGDGSEEGGSSFLKSLSSEEILSALSHLPKYSLPKSTFLSVDVPTLFRDAGFSSKGIYLYIGDGTNTFTH